MDTRKTFGDKTAVAGLSLSMPRGSILALLGPNGAGKTTTVEMCEGFTAPDAGTVRVLGLDPIREAAALKPRIGVMLQGGGAYPGAQAGEMLRLVASYSANPHDSEWLLSTLGLAGSANTPYRRLSGGQQQRLGLACAIVGRPELVFLDEPTAGLDAQARNLVWDLVNALRRDGVSVLLTTHLMDEAEQLADHVAIIDNGALVASGTPEELTTERSAGKLTFAGPALLDTAGLTEHLAASLREDHPPRHVETTAAGRYRVSGAATAQVLAEVASWCAAQGILLSELSTDRRSLEDVFLDLTGRELRG
nr:ABC transporter ATP-binding protein [Tomitella biformata]